MAGARGGFTSRGDPDGDTSSTEAFVDEEFLGHLTSEHPETVPSALRAQLGVEDAPNRRFDAVVLGRSSYQVALDGPLDVWLCGGSQLAGELLDKVDELVVKTYPQVYGSGLPMFGSGFALTDFSLGSVRTFRTGVLVRTYARAR